MRRLRRTLASPKFNFWWCLVFAVYNITSSARHFLHGHWAESALFLAFAGLLTFLAVKWGEKLRDANGGVLYIPRVKVRREYPSINAGHFFAWCTDDHCVLITGAVPGDAEWEEVVRCATEEVIEKYRKSKLKQREGKKASRRAIKEGRRGHRKDGTDHPSGPAEGAVGHTGHGHIAATGAQAGGTTITASAGLTIPQFSAKKGGIRFSGGTITEVKFDTEPIDKSHEEPEEVYTAPVWGYRSWNLTEETIPRLGSMNEGRYTWRPGKNVAMCQATGYEIRTASGATSLSVIPHHPLETPGKDCTCGFYAVREIFDVYNGVVGGVVGWGKIVDGEKGWRSEFAAVAALLLVPWAPEADKKTLEFVASMYGVPVVLTLIDLAEETKKLADWMAGADLLEAT